METQDIITELCQGNPGAVQVLVRMSTVNGNVVDAVYKRFTADPTEIKGWQFWFVYKDICNQQIRETTLYFLRWVTTARDKTLGNYMLERGEITKEQLAMGG